MNVLPQQALAICSYGPYSVCLPRIRINSTSVCQVSLHEDITVLPSCPGQRAAQSPRRLWWQIPRSPPHPDTAISQRAHAAVMKPISAHAAFSHPHRGQPSNLCVFEASECLHGFADVTEPAPIPSADSHRRPLGTTPCCRSLDARARHVEKPPAQQHPCKPASLCPRPPLIATLPIIFRDLRLGRPGQHVSM